jgi:NADP-dependent 3-hydroxy acid dehydrogenase YdfG
MSPGGDEAPRSALVTGASSGFGAAIARAFGARGWSVAIGARRVERLEAVAAEVKVAGGTAFVQHLDVTRSESIAAFVDASERALGPPDVVVSNAGLSIPGELSDLSEDDLRSEVETNLLGPMWLSRRVLPGLRQRRRGDLVFVTSLNAVLPRPLQLGYTATKAGLEAMVRVLQMELEGSGVRATIVRPGPSKTEFGGNWDAGMIQRILESWKLWGVLRHHNFLAPEAIANAVLTAVTAPAGTHLDLIQVNPEAPLTEG